MKRGVPLHSAEGRRLVERGPAWREHPDYYADEPEEDEMVTDTAEDLASRYTVQELAERALAYEELAHRNGELLRIARESIRYAFEGHHLDGNECLCDAARSTLAAGLSLTEGASDA